MPILYGQIKFYRSLCSPLNAGCGMFAGLGGRLISHHFSQQDWHFGYFRVSSSHIRTKDQTSPEILDEHDLSKAPRARGGSDMVLQNLWNFISSVGYLRVAVNWGFVKFWVHVTHRQRAPFEQPRILAAGRQAT